MTTHIAAGDTRANSYDVLISYQRDDDDQRRQLVEALEARGYNVFWDGKSGPDYWRVEWRNHLHQSKLMIVLWSVTAAKSDEVKNEAGGALVLAKCLSVPIDGEEHVPKAFCDTNRHHWDRNADEATRRAQLQKILNTVVRIVGPPHRTAALQPSDAISIRPAPNKLLDRRHFGKCALRFLFVAGVGLAGGRARYEAEAGGSDPIVTFIQLGRDLGTAEEVTATFVRANTPTLMASYSVFFPELFRRRGFAAVNELQLAAAVQKTVYNQDHHRLDALPSVAAAHWMREAKDDTTSGQLTQLILRGLTDARREVREILIQNMITAVAPDFDLVRSFDHRVILQIREIINEACDNEKLT